MKELFLTFTFLIFQISFCQSISNAEIDKLVIGKWAGIDDNGNSNVMILEEGNYVTFSTKDKTFGKEFENDGIKYIYKYSIDTTQNPVNLDFIILRKENNKEEYHFKSIIKFIDLNTLAMRKNQDPTKRPKKFKKNLDKSVLILKRVEN